MAALLFAIGTVLQLRAATEPTDRQAVRACFLLSLVRRPGWLAGIASDGLGFLAQAPTPSPGERIQRRVATALNPFFQIKSLRDFNEKFQPEWLPRSIIVEDPAAFAKVGILFASVEGFLNVPVIEGLLVPPIRSAGEPEPQPVATTSAGGGP